MCLVVELIIFFIFKNNYQRKICLTIYGLIMRKTFFTTFKFNAMDDVKLYKLFLIHSMQLESLLLKEKNNLK